MNLLDTKLVSKKIIEFISASFKKPGFRDAVIGISGGIDSALSCALTVEALGKDHVFPYLLPYGNLNSAGVSDAKLLCDHLSIPQENVTLIDIKPLVAPVIALDNAMDNIRKGNIMARVRMIILFDAAKKRKGLVVGTENKSEHLLGYYTRFGDEASDLEPLQSLYKTQVWRMAKYLKLPEKLITKAPTAGLWEGQTDEGEFGFSYKAADEILYGFYDRKMKISDLIAQGFSKATINQVIDRVMKNAFKRKPNQ